MKRLKSPYIELTFLSEDFKPVHSYYIVQEPKIDQYFYKYKEKDFDKLKLSNLVGQAKKPAFILDLFFKHYINSQDIQQQIQFLTKNDFNLFINLDFNELKNIQNYYRISKHFSKKPNSLKNFNTLYKISRSLIKWIKEHNFSGFFLENFSQNFKFSSLGQQFYYSVDDVSHQIYFSNPSHARPFEELFCEEAPVHPFLVYFQQKLFSHLNNITVISSEMPKLLTLFNVYYLKQLIPVE